MNASPYIEQAIRMGAADAVPFSIDQIAFDSRTRLKCMFGCKDWGRNHTCPSAPGTPSIAEYLEMFSRYSWGVIVHTHDKALSQKISLAIEGKAFVDGHYMAISLSDCSLCKECAAAKDMPCLFRDKARPAFHSVGIDVFKTVRQLGLPLSTLADPDNQQQNWYSAVFVE